MKKSKAVSTEKVNPVFDKLEQLSKVQRIAIYVSVLVLLVGAFIYLLYLPKYERIDNLKTQLTKIQTDLEIAKKNARQLNEYRKKMQDAEEQFKLVMRALPEKEEIPTLLTGISKAGQDAGLTFLLFQPKPEVKKDFFAEIPVAMKVTGDYHSVAIFYENVAELNRIVNIKNIDMSPDKSGTILTTTCTAVTYKFIEADKKAVDKAKNRKSRRKRR